MKKVYLIGISMLLAILAACGNQSPAEESSGNEVHSEETVLHPVEVNILSSGEDFEPGKEGIIEVKVTQGNEPVADADEVLIEIWQGDNQQESVNYEAEHAGDGLYTLAHTFPEEGIYYVIAHVTARDMHVMPKKQFVVGEVDPAELEGKHESDGHEQHDGHHHLGHGLSIHLVEPDILVKGEESQWIVHLAEEDGSPFSGATVRFDYWQDGQAHTLVDATETVAGEYTAAFSFPVSGEFRLVIHIENEDVHEHLETRIQVE